MDANVYRCMIKLRRGLRNRKRLFLIFPPHSTIDAAVQIVFVHMHNRHTEMAASPLLCSFWCICPLNYDQTIKTIYRFLLIDFKFKYFKLMVLITSTCHGMII